VNDSHGARLTDFAATQVDAGVHAGDTLYFQSFADVAAHDHAVPMSGLFAY